MPDLHAAAGSPRLPYVETRAGRLVFLAPLPHHRCRKLPGARLLVPYVIGNKQWSKFTLSRLYAN